MNKWQREYIIENSPSLIKDIRCNVGLLSNLCKYGVLDDAEVSKLITLGNSCGEEEKTYNLLQILKTRVKGYERLTKSLYENKQTAALLTLLYGPQINITNQNPFTFCDIDVNTEEILTKIVDFEGAQLPLSQVCNSINVIDLQKLIKTKLSASSYKNFITNDVLSFALKTVPEPLLYYMPRVLSMDTKIDPSVFKRFDFDIFLIEGIELHQLTLFMKQIKRNSAEIAAHKSSKQVHHLTAKMILLEHPDHFHEIAQKTNLVCHWVKYKSGSYFYIKSSNGRGTQRIKSHLISTKESNLSQDGFIQQVIKDPSNSPVILYDSPGMGKSILLAEIAKSIKTLEPCRSVIFFQLTELVGQFEKRKKEHSWVAFEDLILDVIATNTFCRDILKELFNKNDHNIELFLDGFDEVHKNDLENVKKLLKDIRMKCRNVRIFVTTRLHRSYELEELFGSLGYKILPFNEDNQIDFFLKYWHTQHGIGSSDEIRHFAKSCLAALNTTDNNIAGIPLQCKMLADIFSKDAKRGLMNCSDSEYRIGSVHKMYKEYLDLKIHEGVPREETQFCYDYHTKLAINILFKEDLNILHTETDIDLSRYYKIGVLEPNHANKEIPNFVHKTFAEFLVAEYIADYAIGTGSRGDRDDLASLILHLLFSRILSFVFIDELPWSINEVNIDKNDIRSQYDWVTFDHDPVFRYLTVVQFLNFSLSSRSQQPTIQFREIVRQSKYYSSVHLSDLLTAALFSNVKHVFIFILDLYLDLDTNFLGTNYSFDQYSQSNYFTEKEVQTVLLIDTLKNLERTKQIVTAASLFSSPELVKLSYEFLLYLSNGKHFSNEMFQRHMEYAIRRGNYQIFEYFLNLSKMSLADHAGFVYFCVGRSYKNGASIIEEKAQILKLILNENGNMINEIYPGWGYPPLLSEGVHFSLLKLMISMGADVEKTNINQQNICHLTAEYLDPDDYHEFVKMMLRKGHGNLFIAKNKGNIFSCYASNHVPTSIHTALKNIEVKTETLEMLSKHCKVNFNDKSTLHGSELAYAIIGGRGDRVLKDLVRLGANWKHVVSFNLENVLSLSIKYDNIPALKYFLSLGANPNKRSLHFMETPLMHAIKNSSQPLEFISILVEHGTDINQVFLDLDFRPDGRNYTSFTSPLNYASNISPESAIFLGEKGAVNQSTNLCCLNFYLKCFCYPCFLCNLCLECYQGNENVNCCFY